MAEINAKDLTAKTSPASTDSMLLFGTTSNEGAKITVDNLADNILSRLATKTFPNQVGGSSAATILAQLATLNSNSASSTYFQYKTGSPSAVFDTPISVYGAAIVGGFTSGQASPIYAIIINSGSIYYVRELSQNSNITEQIKNDTHNMVSIAFSNKQLTVTSKVSGGNVRLFGIFA